MHKVIKNRQELYFNIDMLEGQVNRISVTRDIEELNKLYDFALKNLKAMYDFRLKEMEN